MSAEDMVHQTMYLRIIFQVLCVSIYFIVSIEETYASTSCSPSNRTADLAQCLSNIRSLSQSRDEFWFGNMYSTICPEGPDTSLDCMNIAPNEQDSLVTRFFGTFSSSFNPQLIDRYLDVTYTTQKGQYTSCGNTWVHPNSKTFSVDPVSSDYYHPYDTILIPEMTWSSTNGEYYFLMIYDVGNFISHGVYINIPGDDINNAEEIKEYAGPKNPRGNVNPYMFILFKQNSMITLSSEWRTTLSSTVVKYNMSEVVSTFDLQGPVAMNWVRILLDPYSVQHFIDRQRMNNCAFFVTEAIKEVNRTFVPDDVYLSVFMTVQFRPAAMSFTYCCNDDKINQVTRYLNPLGNSEVNAGEVRTGVTPLVRFVRKATFPEATIFNGTLHTLLCVDPDVPVPTAGTQEKPLLHWQVVNIQNGTVSLGTELKTYRGPAPPDNKYHQYYFLLYEQTSVMNTTDMDRYVSPNCSSGRCLFDISRFVGENGLDLVGASWFKATTDNYVKYYYTEVAKRDKDSFCSGVSGYAKECPTSGSGFISLSTILVSIALAITFLR